MPVLVEHPVTPKWRERMLSIIRVANSTFHTVAVAAGTSQAAVSYVLTKAKSGSLVPQIERAILSLPPATLRRPQEVVTAEVAALREARDAITADIVRLETARATLEERLVEAYEHRAKLDVRIRERKTSG